MSLLNEAYDKNHYRLNTHNSPKVYRVALTDTGYNRATDGTRKKYQSISLNQHKDLFSRFFFYKQGILICKIRHRFYIWCPSWLSQQISSGLRHGPALNLIGWI